MRRVIACLIASAALCVASLACVRRDVDFDAARAYRHVEEQCAFGPRLVGSEASRQAADDIVSALGGNGWSVILQEFEYLGVPVRNVVGKKGEGALTILGAHYDSRAVADRDPADRSQPVLGANDGASGVAVLLELSRTLNMDAVGGEVWLAFFDAEDQGGINGWPFSVGAAYMAESLSDSPEAVVVVDMVGDADQVFYWEGNSDPVLTERLWGIAEGLGYEDVFISQPGYTIMDDHVPFRRKGWAAVDIIDFDYPYWHTLEDTPDKVSAASLERVGRVLEEWLEQSK